ncbi:MAG: hypothetical protein Q8Q09_20230 [Deltaproteobacteria bacterium]|nr:hypothetical protein [Deltaproteobacteria bacterium]
MKTTSITSSLVLFALSSVSHAQTAPTAPTAPAVPRPRAEVAARLASSPALMAAVARCGERRSGSDCELLAQIDASATVSIDQAQVDAFLQVQSSGDSAGVSVRVGAPREAGGATDTALNASAVLDVFAQGMTGFLLDRARVELQRSIVERVARDACGEGGPLRNTCAVLGGSGLSMPMPGFGPGLRAGFERDVLSLPRWSLAHAAPATDSATATQRFALEIAVLLLDVSGPLALFDRLDQRMAQWPSNDLTVLGLQRTVRLLRLLALAQTVSEDTAEVSPSARTRAVQLLLSLDGSIQQNHLQSALPTVIELTRGLYEAERAARTLADESLDESTRRARIASLGASLVSSLQSMATLLRVPASSLAGLQRVVQFAQAMASGDLARVMTASVALLQESGVALSEPWQLSLRVLAMGAEFAAARTPRQAEMAIAAFAAPPGSWQAKHEHPSLSLNGFVGMGGGLEVLFAGSSGTAQGGYIAPTAALGLDLTRPGWANGWAHGLFVSVIDLGALVNASTASQHIAPSMTTMTRPEARTHPGQMLAPGIFARVNIARSPVVFSLGASLMPFGRELDYGGGRVDTVPSLRAGATLSIDVPIVPFGF